MIGVPLRLNRAFKVQGPPAGTNGSLPGCRLEVLVLAHSFTRGGRPHTVAW
jgi:hypothetical protein